ncbi:hypothetical protein ACLHDD_19905 [Pantoea sp. NSTU24]|uniref:hypothetical protein n=1 Tax=Pantoea sp. NSTU24 TaxID=3391144 RepID=UPI003CFC6BED
MKFVMFVTAHARLKLRLHPYTAINTDTNTSAQLQIIKVPAIRLARPARVFFVQIKSIRKEHSGGTLQIFPPAGQTPSEGSGVALMRSIDIVAGEKDRMKQAFTVIRRRTRNPGLTRLAGSL